MKVLLDAQITGTDGIGRCTRELVAALQRRFERTGDVLVVEPARPVPRYSLAEGEYLASRAVDVHADVIHLLDYRVPLDTDGIPVISTVHDLLRVRRPDACYTDAQFEERFGGAGLTQLRRAVLALDPGPDAGEGLHHRFVRAMTRRACRTSRAVMAPTAAVGREVTSLFPGCPVRVAHWGVDRFPASGALPEALRGCRYLLYVGQDRPHKRVRLLTEAFLGSAACRSGVVLALAGRDFDPFRPGAAHRDTAIVHLGAVADEVLPALYENALLSVHLADSEGFGLPPLEALAHGSPVLARDHPVLREVLGSHARFTGAVSVAQTSQALDDALHMVDTPAERASRRRWTGRFTWDECAARVIDAYGSAIA